MRLFLALGVLLAAAPAADAATVAAKLVDGRLEVRYRAAPGERNELRMLPHDSGVRFAGSAPSRLVATARPWGRATCVAARRRRAVSSCTPAPATSDVIRCGPGRDVAYFHRRDRTTGCERIVLGWPG